MLFTIHFWLQYNGRVSGRKTIPAGFRLSKGTNAPFMTSQEKIKVVVFDLNQTFYRKSSKEEFYKFICSKRPKRLRFIFELVYFKILSKLNLLRQTEFKENFFNYLDDLPPETVEVYAEEFWRREFPKKIGRAHV